MNIYIDTGNRLEGWYNVDPFGQAQKGDSEGRVEDHWFPTDGKAEVIIIQRVFERMKDKLHKFMVDIRKALSDDGVLHLLAINHEQFQILARDQRYKENCFGPYWSSGDVWVQNYENEKNIIELFANYGFQYIGESPEGANYPCFKMMFKKKYLHVPTEYFSQYLPTDPNLNTVDIGPGNHPWKMAKNYIEHPSRLTDSRYKPENMPSVNVFFGDLQKGIPEIKDKQFDFAWASHIFEHLDDPVAAAKELSRIAKRGVVVVPSAYKDAMCYWEEWEHKFDIFPPPTGSNIMRFVRRNEEWLKPLKDQECQAIFGRLYRYQNFDTREERYVKRFFMDNEDKYDVLIEWNDKFEIEVI